MAEGAFAPDVEPLLGELLRSSGGNAARIAHADRSVVKATGGDRVRFLDGMISQHVAPLAPGQTQAALQLDRKGHLVGQLDVLVFEGEIWLEVRDGRGPAVLETLAKHVIADDVEFTPIEPLAVVSFEGADAARALAASGAPELEPGTARRSRDEGAELVWVGGGAFGRHGLRLLAAPEAVAGVVAASGLPELDAEQVDTLRIAAFQPRFGAELDGRTFPAEARLDETAVSFTKGCYIGQEIVARIHSRGAVNRLLVQLRSDAPLRAGDEIRAGERSVGSVTSAARTRGGGLALGYVKRAHAEPGERLVVGSAAAVVVGPPFS